MTTATVEYSPVSGVHEETTPRWSDQSPARRARSLRFVKYVFLAFALFPASIAVSEAALSRVDHSKTLQHGAEGAGEATVALAAIAGAIEIAARRILIQPVSPTYPELLAGEQVVLEPQLAS